MKYKYSIFLLLTLLIWTFTECISQTTIKIYCKNTAISNLFTSLLEKEIEKSSTIEWPIFPAFSLTSEAGIIHQFELCNLNYKITNYTSSGNKVIDYENLKQRFNEYKIVSISASIQYIINLDNWFKNDISILYLGSKLYYYDLNTIYEIGNMFDTFKSNLGMQVSMFLKQPFRISDNMSFDLSLQIPFFNVDYLTEKTENPSLPSRLQNQRKFDTKFLPVDYNVRFGLCITI